MSSEMNVIWKKDKLQKYSKESITLSSPALASGDSVELHCRLCGATDALQLITNNRLDETLRLYFGVQVPPEGVICRSCVKCMKITEGFSALVHASFEKTDSEDFSTDTRILADFSPGAINLPTTNPQKEILSLLKTRLTLEDTPRRREARHKIRNMNSKVVIKKMIIACTVCGQKYPMFMPQDGVHKFVCSRCQLETRDCKKNNTQSSVKNKNELRCKIDLKRKNRLYSLPQQVKQDHSAKKYDHLTRHQCGQCPKKYAMAQNLATHIKTVHEVSAICSDGGKKLKSTDYNIMEKHKRGFKNSRCTECVQVFKSTRSHRVCHEKQNKSLST